MSKAFLGFLDESEASSRTEVPIFSNRNRGFPFLLLSSYETRNSDMHVPSVLEKASLLGCER